MNSRIILADVCPFPGILQRSRFPWGGWFLVVALIGLSGCSSPDGGGKTNDCDGPCLGEDVVCAVGECYNVEECAGTSCGTRYACLHNVQAYCHDCEGYDAICVSETRCPPGATCIPGETEEELDAGSDADATRAR